MPAQPPTQPPDEAEACLPLLEALAQDSAPVGLPCATRRQEVITLILGVVGRDEWAPALARNADYLSFLQTIPLPRLEAIWRETDFHLNRVRVAA